MVCVLYGVSNCQQCEDQLCNSMQLKLWIFLNICYVLGNEYREWIGYCVNVVNLGFQKKNQDCSY